MAAREIREVWSREADTIPRFLTMARRRAVVSAVVAIGIGLALTVALAAALR